MTRKQVTDQLGEPSELHDNDKLGWIRWDPDLRSSITSAVRYRFVHVVDKDTALAGDIVIGYDKFARLVTFVED